MSAALAMRLPRARVRENSSETARLGAWLLCWVVLPNLGFWLLWLFGAPPRTVEIIGTGVLGLLVRRQPGRLQFIAFLGALVWSALGYVSAVFNLSITDVVQSVGFLLELKPIGSIEYLLALFVVAGLLAGAMAAFRRPDAFRSPFALLVAVAAILAVAAADYVVSYSSRGTYQRFAAPGAPFSSATRQIDLLGRADGSRHIVLVMVESMGAPRDPALRQALLGRWSRPDIAARYAVRFGTTPYYGATSRGEMRELCGRWDSYASVANGMDPRCLPAQLRARGYETSAVHSFTADFFHRDRWYPHIGFDHMAFRDTLLQAGAAPCAGVFPGVCDRDVPAILARRLLAAHRPQFLYWLTVNSHLPVPPVAALRTENCLARRPDFPVKNVSICRLVAVIDDMNDALARALLAPDFPDADILLVGDHMPPFFDHGSRAAFDPAQVSWVLLSRRKHGAVASR